MSDQRLFSTETTCVTLTGLVEAHPAAWLALCDWLRFHGIDPADLPCHNLIERDLEQRQIRYDAIRRDADGNRLNSGPPDYDWQVVTGVKQGETPPKPWPPEVLALEVTP